MAKKIDGAVSQAIDFGSSYANLIAARLRRRLKNILRYHPEDAIHYLNILEMSRAELAKFAPLYAQAILDSQLAAWVRGLEIITNKTPKSIVNEIASSQFPPRPVLQYAGFTPVDQPLVEIPAFNATVQSLINKKVLRKDEFEEASRQVRQRAFTVANVDTKSKLEQIKNKLADAMVGRGKAGFNEQVRDIVGKGKLTENHINTVFRVGAMKSYAEGQEHMMSHELVRGRFPYAAYYATHDERVRENHFAMEKFGLDGTNIYRSDDPVWTHFTPPWEWNCLLPGTFVDGSFSKAHRIRYSGKCVKVTVDGGRVLSMTINHPVLTKNGFVSAGDLHYGLDLFCDRRRIFIGGRPEPKNENDKPVVAEEVFKLLSKHGSLDRREVLPNDLYGDGAFGVGKIDVVGVDWELPFHRNGHVLKDRLLAASDARKVLVPRLSAFNAGGFGSRLVSHSSPSSIELFSPLLAGHSFPFDEFLFGLSTKDYPHRFESVADDMAGYVTAFGDAGNAFSGGVPLLPRFDDGGGNVLTAVSSLSCLKSSDAERLKHWPRRFVTHGVGDFDWRALPSYVQPMRISNIEFFNFDGHVYDFQSSNGMILANGIVTGNCRCRKLFMTVRQAARAGVKEAQTWLDTGVPPIEVNWKISIIPFKPDPRFTQIKVVL